MSSIVGKTTLKLHVTAINLLHSLVSFSLSLSLAKRSRSLGTQLDKQSRSRETGREKEVKRTVKWHRNGNFNGNFIFHAMRARRTADSALRATFALNPSLSFRFFTDVTLEQRKTAR